MVRIFSFGERWNVLFNSASGEASGHACHAGHE